ncbi:transposon Tf2-8 polyprotein [Trichonephila clavipes]|nr:transposon Tf2-8 polyprotein [Trichonephila clavipes]
MNKKSTQKKYGLLEEVPVAEEPSEMILLDTVGGFNYHNSQKKYLHIVLDHATRYAWTFPSKSVTSETYTNCSKQIFSIQCPKQLLSDRNAAFTSSKFKKFLKHHNITHKKIIQSPYNGPFKVVRKLSNVTYEIDKPNQYTGKLTDIVHSTRLKPFHSKSNFQLC